MPFKVSAQTDVHNLTQADLNRFNPLPTETFGANPTPGAIISRALTFIYPLAAMIFFVLLVVGGIQMMMGGMSGKEDSIKQGKGRIKAAVIGFVIILGSLTILLLIQTLLKIKIIGF